MYGAYTYKCICTCMERIHINVLLKKGDPLRFYITLWLHTPAEGRRELGPPALQLRSSAEALGRTINLTSITFTNKTLHSNFHHTLRIKPAGAPPAAPQAILCKHARVIRALNGHPSIHRTSVLCQLFYTPRR